MGTHVIRRRFMLSGTMLMSALSGYAGRVYAACVNSGGSTYLCSGANTTAQTISANNAAVSTASGFSVDTSGGSGDAITITGDGALSFTDAYYSPLTGAGRALYIRSNGNIAGGNNGSVTVDTNGALTGGSSTTCCSHGIFARNFGSGALAITPNGDVTGGGNYISIFAYNYGSDLTVTTGAGTTVTGANGITAVNGGSGALSVTANGDVTGTGTRGIFANNAGTELSVTTGAGTTVTAAGHGIYARNRGSGALTVTANGDVKGTSTTRDGIYAYNGSSGSALAVTTGAGTTVTGGSYGIYAYNYGSGALTVTAGGDVTGTNDDGIYARNFVRGSDVTVTTGAGTTVTGGSAGIYAVNLGSGALTVTANGDVTAGGRGIYAFNVGTDLTVTTGAGTTVTGDTDGIHTRNFSGGALTVTVGGTSTVTSNGTAAGDFAIDIEGSPGAVMLAGTLSGGAGGALRFDPVAASNDRLELRPGAAISGTVLAGPGTDTLELGGAGSASFDAGGIGAGLQFQDFETFVKTGTSTWTLTGTTSAVTPWTINAGTLAVNGSIANTTFTVNAGGTLGGTGTAGSVTLAGGTFAPGNSIGTLNVAGDVDFSGGGVLEVEVDAAGNADKIAATGTATLTGGKVQVLPEAGEYDFTTDYTILTAAGGLGGTTFNSVSSSLAFLTPTLSYDANNVFLNLTRNNVSFDAVVATPNQAAVAEVLTALSNSNPQAVAELTDALLLLTPEGARQAFDSLVGAQHTHGQALIKKLGYRFQELLAWRGRHPDQNTLAFNIRHFDPWQGPLLADNGAGWPLPAAAMPAHTATSTGRGVWLQGFGGFGDIDDSASVRGADYDTYGFAAGVDTDWHDVVIGLAGSYARSNADTFGGNLDIDSIQFAAYGDWQRDRVYVHASAGFGYHATDAERAVVVGALVNTATADYDTWAFNAAVEAGKAMPLTSATTLTPFAGLTFSRDSRDGFTETGAGTANLRIDEENEGSFRTRLGLRLSHSVTTSPGTHFTPAAYVAYVRELDNVSRQNANFAALPTTTFRVEGTQLGQDRLQIGAGVSGDINGNTTFHVGYDGELASSDDDHRFSASLRYSW